AQRRIIARPFHRDGQAGYAGMNGAGFPAGAGRWYPVTFACFESDDRNDERSMMDDSRGSLVGETSVTPTSTPGPDDAVRGRRSALLIVFLVVFIDLLGFGIVLPLLPLYANELLVPLLGEDQRV